MFSIVHWSPTPLTGERDTVHIEITTVTTNLTNLPDLFLFYHLDRVQTDALENMFPENDYARVDTLVPNQEAKERLKQSCRYNDQYYGVIASTTTFNIQKLDTIRVGPYEKIQGIFTLTIKGTSFTVELLSSPSPTGVYSTDVKPTPFCADVTIFSSIQGVNELWERCLKSIRRPLFSTIPPIVCSAVTYEQSDDGKKTKVEEIFCTLLSSQKVPTHYIECKKTNPISFTPTKNPLTSIRPPNEIALHFHPTLPLTAKVCDKINAIAGIFYDPWKK